MSWRGHSGRGTGRPSPRLPCYGRLGKPGLQPCYRAPSRVVALGSADMPGRPPLGCAPLPATRLASGSSDGTVKIWNPATGHCVSTLKGHFSSVWSVAWSHDAALLASGSGEKTVKIWDPATGLCVSTLKGHFSLVRSVAWSHDAALLASGSHDQTVKIWDPATGQCVSTLNGHGDQVSSVTWSHDATRLASGSWDMTVKIWDPATGQCVSTLKGNDILSVAWSHDATRLASGSSDKIKIWDPETGQCVLTLNGHSDQVWSVSWSGTLPFPAASKMPLSPDRTAWESAMRDRGAAGPPGGQEAGSSATVQPAPDRDGKSAITAMRIDKPKSTGGAKDARLLASGSGDKTVKIWDPALEGADRSTLRGSFDDIPWLDDSAQDAERASPSGGNNIMILEPLDRASPPRPPTIGRHSPRIPSPAPKHPKPEIGGRGSARMLLSGLGSGLPGLPPPGVQGMAADDEECKPLLQPLPQPDQTGN